MEFKTRKLVKPGDLNPRNTLFGGRLLRWIDEEAAICVTEFLETPFIVTKYMSEIDFVRPAIQGDIVEIGIDITSVGTTSVTVQCEVRNKTTKEILVTIGKIVFVRVDRHGNSKAHGKKILN